MNACCCVNVQVACQCVRARTRGCLSGTASCRGRGYIPAKAVMPAPIWLARHRQEPSHQSPVIDMRPHLERFARGGEKLGDWGGSREREGEEREQEGEVVRRRRASPSVTTLELTQPEKKEEKEERGRK